MSDSFFTVAGVSTQHGSTKVRFANDLVSRTKLLAKGGHDPLELVQLPKAMTKAEACQYLIQLGGVFTQWETLINETMGKKSSIPAAQKAAKAPKVAKASATVKAPAKTKAVKQPKITVAPKAEDEDLEIEELKQIAA